MAKYSSHGSPVTFTLDANGELVGTSADGREVLRAELDLVESNGNWSVTAKVTLGPSWITRAANPLDLPLTVTPDRQGWGQGLHRLAAHHQGRPCAALRGGQRGEPG